MLLNIKLNKENIHSSIDYVVRNVLISETFSTNEHKKSARIIVSGGGEPTLERDLLIETVDTVNYYKSLYGNEIVKLSIITNGQFDNEMSEYIIDNFDEIAVSSDGISVQDFQRPRIDSNSSSKYVINFMDSLKRKNKKFSIRMTITGNSRFSLEKDIDYFIDKYSNIDSIFLGVMTL